MVGVTGGVAAYKAAELVRLLGKAGAEVHVVLSEAGARFVTAVTFQALSGNPVWTDLWDARMPNNMAHIDLGRDADAIFVAPATADFIARLAHGRADDLLTTLCLARDVPLIVAPAMNRQMWEAPATQRNVSLVRADGVTVFGPGAGEQACGETGMGRMLEPEELLERLEGHFVAKRLAGCKVVLTAGPTFEAIDPVRGITNISSGKMGYALARACAQAGAEVVLVSGPVALPVPVGVRCVPVAGARDMRDAVLAALPDAPFCVGFAAESQDLDAYAENKRRKKRLPLLVGNLVQDGMGAEDNVIVLYDDAGRHPVPRASKSELARSIVEHLAGMLATVALPH